MKRIVSNNDKRNAILSTAFLYKHRMSNLHGFLDCYLPGGGALRYRGGPHLRYVFRGRRGLFIRPPHVRDFVKEGYFFVPRYEVWGSKSPYNPRNIRGSDAE